MKMRRFILEMGAGNDLHGRNYTKAALRAVEDALRHSSLGFAKVLGLDSADMQVKVTIGVYEPDAVDAEKVRAYLPRGTASVTVVKGGLNVPDDVGEDGAVIATAAIEVWLPVATRIPRIDN